MSRFVEHFRAIVGNHGSKTDAKMQAASAKKKEEKTRIANLRKHSGAPLPHIQRSDFQVGSMIGQGSFATVHKAKHIPTGRDVAIKVVRPESELDFGTGPNGSSPGVCYDDVLKAMKLEVKIVETLGKHPYLVEILGTADDCKVFVMEKAASDLYSIVKKQGAELPLQMAAQWAEQMLSATVYMHEMGVVHQDIKSSNVLIFPDRTAKMCDFGLARQAAKIMCVDRELITLWYRAPELLMGESVYTEKVDEWGVGTILLEMIIGHSPFRGKPDCFCSCPQISHRNYNSDQLMKVFAMMGTPKERTLLARMSCHGHFSKWPHFPRKLESTVTKHVTEHRCDTWLPGKPESQEDLGHIATEWCSIIAGLLQLDPEKRLDAQTALDSVMAWADSRPRGPKSPQTPTEASPKHSPKGAMTRLPSRQIRRRSLDGTTGPASKAQVDSLRRTGSDVSHAHSAAKPGTEPRPHADSAIKRSVSAEAEPPAMRRTISDSAEPRLATLRRRGSETGSSQVAAAPAQARTSTSSSSARRKSFSGPQRTSVVFAAPVRKSSDDGEHRYRRPTKPTETSRRASIKDLAGDSILKRTCSAPRRSSTCEDVHG